MGAPKSDYEKGVTLLLAIVVVSIVLSIGLNLSVLATKELGFARLASDSIKAHYAAESALECAIYWLFQNTEYFSISEAHDIFCNNEAISVGGSDTSVIEISGEDDEYASVEVRRDAPFNKRNFTLSSEGFNEDPTAGVDPSLVQQELGAVSIEGCRFNPEDADASGVTVPPIEVSNSSNLQSTLDTAFGSNAILTSNNTGYQTWRIENNTQAKVILQAIAISSSADSINTFGFYINEPGNLFTHENDVYAADAFNPVFGSYSEVPSLRELPNYWGAPKTHGNTNHSSVWTEADWETFEIEVPANAAIAFGIDRQIGNNSRSNYTLRTTEIGLNDPVDQYAQVYEVPEVLWHEADVPEFVLAFEDAFNHDDDFNDFVAVVRVQNCINTLQRY